MSRQIRTGIGAVAAAALAAGVLSGCAAGVSTGASASGLTQLGPSATGTSSALTLPDVSTTIDGGTGGTPASTNTAAGDGSTGNGTGTGSGSTQTQPVNGSNGSAGSNGSSGNGSGGSTGTGSGSGSAGSTGSGTAGHGGTTSSALPVCAPSGLAATVFVVAGSQGMGHELLNVSLININDPKCTLYGYPGFQLRGQDMDDQPGADQPTNVVWEPGIPKTLITLASTQEASTTVQIDDDVPAGGEPQSGACEPDSYYLGVTPPNDTSQVVQRINGPMAVSGVTVCEHGTLDVYPFVAGSVGPDQ